jgi:hypothetical protein
MVKQPLQAPEEALVVQASLQVLFYRLVHPLQELRLEEVLATEEPVAFLAL